MSSSRGHAPGINNFDAFRLLAAMLVFIGHAFAFYGRVDPFAGLVPFASMAEFGVDIFFIVSGYLVAQSYERQDNIWRFLRNRALRILPGLWVVVLVCTFVLGPMVTTDSWRDYFRDPQTWDYLRTLLVFPVQFDLPGVFLTNANRMVNGPLWTIPHEVRCYLALGALGTLSLLRPRVMLLVFAGLWSLHVWGLMVRAQGVPALFPDYTTHAFELAALFAGGAALHVARAYLPRSLPHFLIALLLIALSLALGKAALPLFNLGIIYVVIYLAETRLPLIGDLGRRGDVSYGIYLYAYPIQQTTVAALHEKHFLLFLAITFTATLACAYVSWRWVESRALDLKG